MTVHRVHPDEECVECEGSGHLDGCDALEPAWDLGDLICRSPCTGCCPNKCRPSGLQAEKDAAAVKVRRVLRDPR